MRNVEVTAIVRALAPEERLFVKPMTLPPQKETKREDKRTMAMDLFDQALPELQSNGSVAIVMSGLRSEANLLDVRMKSAIVHYAKKLKRKGMLDFKIGTRMITTTGADSINPEEWTSTLYLFKR